jgi:Lon protease-like protein
MRNETKVWCNNPDGNGATDMLPVFPLPVFLLSGGMQRLRIVEPKYLSLVAEAEKNQGFVISPLKKAEPYSSSDWGTQVKIVDFDKDEFGVLTIDVLANHLVSLSGFEHDNKGLLIAKAKFLPHWSCIHKASPNEETGDFNVENSELEFSSLLRQIFESHHELHHLYKVHYFDYANWVSARLLEVIPIPLSEKEKFVYRLDLRQLNELLYCLCRKELTQNDLFTSM